MKTKLLKTNKLPIFLLCLTLIVLGTFQTSNYCQAAVEFKQLVKIGGESRDIGSYIKEVYKYSIGIVGILAAVVMMFGGVVWISAGGNQSKIGEAKAWITGSITGLVLVFTSYTILNTINPDLVSFKKIDLPKAEPFVCCKIDNSITKMIAAECTEKKGSIIPGSDCSEVIGCCMIKEIMSDTPYCKKSTLNNCQESGSIEKADFEFGSCASDGLSCIPFSDTNNKTPR